MKVMILVLSARRDPWDKMMDTSLETWDSEDHPQTQTLYYCGKSQGGSTAKVFYSPIYDEGLEQVSGRTIEAFEKALELNWDFMARTHSSTYVHKRNLVAFVETLPRDNVLLGLLTTGAEPFLWGGGSYIISRDVVENLVANKHFWNFRIMEDNSLTNLARELDIQLSGNGRMASIDHVPDGYLVTTYGIGEGFKFTDWSDVKKVHPHYYIRCKQDFGRHEDLEIFRQLHRNFI
jgi:hypothetical protein